MFKNFRKKEPVSVAVENPTNMDMGASTSSAILGASTQPLLIHPDASADLKQKKYRKNAIERYVTQRREEGRPIPDTKMAELEDEYTLLTIAIRRLEKDAN